MSFYAFAVNDAAVVECKNWMLSLGRFPPLLFLCIIYDLLFMYDIAPSPAVLVVMVVSV